MTRIFEPLLENAIIYIDDILLFSKDQQSHQRLLQQFVSLADRYGIMLSEKKIHLAKTSIDFLGMNFSQGAYQPQPHIAQELLNFPNDHLSIKQIRVHLMNFFGVFSPLVLLAVLISHMYFTGAEI